MPFPETDPVLISSKRVSGRPWVRRVTSVEIPSSTWFDAIFARRSRRQFDAREVEPNALRALYILCREFKPFPSVRAALVNHSPAEVFKGAVGPYGKVKGAPSFMAFIGDMDGRNIQEKVGYLGEGIILEATALNLATCWVGGFFRPEVAGFLVSIRGHERVLAVTPIGYAPDDWSWEEKIMSGFGRSHRRKPLTELVAGLEEKGWPDWMKVALQAARLAPSAVNRQPWRFEVGPESVTISVGNQQDTFHISKRMDCGIAMLHLEVALQRCGLRGRWRFLEPPNVARLLIDALPDAEVPLHPSSRSVGPEEAVPDKRPPTLP
jgi:nitroreductase